MREKSRRGNSEDEEREREREGNGGKRFLYEEIALGCSVALS